MREYHIPTEIRTTSSRRSIVIVLLLSDSSSSPTLLLSSSSTSSWNCPRQPKLTSILSCQTRTYLFSTPNTCASGASKGLYPAIMMNNMIPNALATPQPPTSYGDGWIDLWIDWGFEAVTVFSGTQPRPCAHQSAARLWPTFFHNAGGVSEQLPKQNRLYHTSAQKHESHSATNNSHKI